MTKSIQTAFISGLFSVILALHTQGVFASQTPMPGAAGSGAVYSPNGEEKSHYDLVLQKTGTGSDIAITWERAFPDGRHETEHQRIHKEGRHFTVSSELGQGDGVCGCNTSSQEVCEFRLVGQDGVIRSYSLSDDGKSLRLLREDRVNGKLQQYVWEELK